MFFEQIQGNLWQKNLFGFYRVSEEVHKITTANMLACYLLTYLLHGAESFLRS